MVSPMKIFIASTGTVGLYLFGILPNLVSSISHHPILLVISYDGFRYNYFDKNVTPNMKKLQTTGTHAEYMMNVFVTKTLPNHQTIATGVYPEVHGVLGKNVFDPLYNKRIDPRHYSSIFWHFNDAVIPIWTLNQKAGEGRHSGVMMWPGGDQLYLNTTITFNQIQNESITFEERIDMVLSWILHEKTPANLVLVYIPEPDKTAHMYGPESQEVLTAISRVDNVTGHLVKKMEELNLTNAVNLFLLSDHGFETVTPTRLINLTDLMPPGVNYTSIIDSPLAQIFTKLEDEDAVYHELKNASKGKHFSVYKKSELPEKWHYKNNRRMPPIFLLTEESYAFREDMYDYYSKAYNKSNKTFDDKTAMGVHGYDNAAMNMHPFFIAVGPLIKKEYKIDPFDSVDLYSLFCYMLHLTPPGTNGTLDNVKSMLAGEQDSLPLILGGVVAVILFIVISVIIIICLQRCRKNKADPTANNSYRMNYGNLDP